MSNRIPHPESSCSNLGKKKKLLEEGDVLRTKILASFNVIKNKKKKNLLATSVINYLIGAPLLELRNIQEKNLRGARTILHLFSKFILALWSCKPNRKVSFPKKALFTTACVIAYISWRKK
jgi:hypothetical protein